MDAGNTDENIFGIVTDSGNAGNASSSDFVAGADSSGNSSGNGDGRKRGRKPRNGQSSERSTGDSTGDNKQKRADRSDSVRVVSGKPNDAGYKTPAMLKKGKRGYRPLLDEKESIAAVDNIFGLAATAIDSRWTLEPDESKELGERLFKVLELFPVKLEDNAETLQKAFAIIGLLVGLLFICQPRFKETMEGKNDGIFGKLTQKETAATAAA